MFDDGCPGVAARRVPAVSHIGIKDDGIATKCSPSGFYVYGIDRKGILDHCDDQ